ncbi:DNA adenine methylase [Pantoea coffeiphila]|uniref:Site-specific DNA-methyltransferase (adenine-specific) n=1 Tax=Pantoea coffeiphila TaxID=1465635 RepID=A0A2S9IC01_9GAMM|nr:DNA adenine methylase [Pantoea coffeiphila]PRD15306.1 DNA adenine methylase [Pantoea coffeiphila]
MNTVLKWVGSKSRIMPELVKHLPAGRRLVEPFAGSCAVMMSTDYPAYLVADINPDLINLYRQIQDNAEKFLLLAESFFAINETEEDYYRAREAFNKNASLSLLHRAVYFLFLNRAGYRGVCRYNRRGEFNVPYGNYKHPYFPREEIKAFSVKSQRAEFICAEFRETISMVTDGDVIYCDPPYVETFNDYHSNGFDSEEQAELACLLMGVSERNPVVASNSDTPLVRKLYAGFDIRQIAAPRSIGVVAGKGRSAIEIIAVASPAAAVWVGYDPGKGDLSASVPSGVIA